MTEILFILVTLYVAYVVRSTSISKKNDNPGKPVTKKKSSAVKKDVVNDSKVKAEKAKTIVKKDKVKKPTVVKEKKTQKNIKMPTGSLRDPETGEEVKIASSYRMLRRWIKDALVDEGLVEKVYKTNELDAGTINKINKAVDKLKKMDKYQ